VIEYSAPRLQVTPREGVGLDVSVSDYGGGVVLEVRVINDSPTAFRFSREDLQLYVGKVRIKPTETGADVPTAIAAPGSGSDIYLYFRVGDFDPYAAGLLYVSSDPESGGFTAMDGPVPAGFTDVTHDTPYGGAITDLFGRATVSGGFSLTWRRTRIHRTLTVLTLAWPCA
jgi:hypothetical protein